MERKNPNKTSSRKTSSPDAWSGGSEHLIRIEQGADVARAVLESQLLLKEIGFERTRQFLVATAVSELARNILVHAEKGTVTLKALEAPGLRGFEVVASDQGPGIADVELALTDGYSTRRSLGLGLPGVQRIMDEIDIQSVEPSGTRICARKWEDVN